MFIPNFFNQQPMAANLTKQLFRNFNLPKTQNNVVPMITLKTERQPSYDSVSFNNFKNHMPFMASPPITISQTENEGHMVTDNTFNWKTGISEAEWFIRWPESEYTEKDAAIYQWKKSNTAIQTAWSQLRDYLQTGNTEGVTIIRSDGVVTEFHIENLFLMPTQEEYDVFMAQLRTNGLGKEIDWVKLSDDFNLESASWATAISESRIDMLASAYAVLEARVKSDFSGDEQVKQLEKLHQFIFSTIESEAEAFADIYGSIYGEEEKFKSSVINAYMERIKEYQSHIANNEDFAKLKGTQNEWLLRDDTYMAQKLRNAAGSADTIKHSSNDDFFTLGELKTAVEVSELLREMHYGRHSISKGEAEMGLGLAIWGMKIEMLANSGLVGNNMADVIKKAFNNSIEKYISNTQEFLADKRNNPQIASDTAGFAPLVEKYVLDVFNKSMEAFRRTDDAIRAIQEGVDYSRRLFQTVGYIRDTQGTYSYNNGVLYFDNFFNDTIFHSARSGINGSIGMVSAFQQHANNWSFFIDSLNAGKFMHRNENWMLNHFY